MKKRGFYELTELYEIIMQKDMREKMLLSYIEVRIKEIMKDRAMRVPTP